MCLHTLKESIQLAQLDGSDVLYLEKEAAPSPVQMVSGPGAKFPTHATGLGKLLLSCMSDEQIDQLFPDDELARLTPHTLRTKQELLNQLEVIRKQGYSMDLREGAMGFNCIAAPHLVFH
jgi:DNA-binding IclR family transcriptional regulator